MTDDFVTTKAPIMWFKFCHLLSFSLTTYPNCLVFKLYNLIILNSWYDIPSFFHLTTTNTERARCDHLVWLHGVKQKMERTTIKVNLIKSCGGLFLFVCNRGCIMHYWTLTNYVHYCTHLCCCRAILHSIIAVVQSRELGQAPILVFLILMQALSSHPRQHMVWLYMSASSLLGLQGPQQALAEHICYILDTTPSTVMACWDKHCGLTCQLV